MSKAPSLLLIGAAALLAFALGFLIYEYVAVSRQFLRLPFAG